jgi:hypothetical protein
MKKSIVALALVLVSAPLLSNPRPAGAQSTAPFDHLKCYKISAKQGALIQNKPHIFDPLVLTPLQRPPFDVEDCFLLPKTNPLPREICVPVNKQPAQPPAGLDLRNDYLCYIARCTSQPDLPLVVKDQFVRGSVTVHRKSPTASVPAWLIRYLRQFDSARSRRDLHHPGTSARCRPSAARRPAGVSCRRRAADADRQGGVAEPVSARRVQAVPTNICQCQ